MPPATSIPLPAFWYWLACLRLEGCVHADAKPAEGSGQESLAALEDTALDIERLVASASRILARTIPYDAACWHTVDPITVLETTSLLENILPTRAACRRSSISTTISTSSRSSRDRSAQRDPECGQRWRPDPKSALSGDHGADGLEGELRAAFVVHGACWGSVGLFREAPGDFAPDEAALLHDLAPSLARAFRSAAVDGTHVANGVAAGPGLVLFDAQRCVEAVTPAA
ncbi:MAG: hypothetical protein JWQ48_255, partial [Conexibacter sp.]|nr:hypothetical protein [Conexibacter sp.]